VPTVDAAIYVRVSSARQVAEGLSLDEQERRCRDFAESRSWTLHAHNVYREEGISGAKRSRPALDALMEAVDAGEVDVLISPAIDRIGRSLGHTEELFSRFDAAKIDLWKPSGERYSGEDGSAKFARRVLGAAAELERDMISERVAAVTEAKARRGSYHGGIAPYGYVTGDSGGLEVHEPEAKWVRQMFRRYAHEGTSLYRIAQELTEADAPVKRGGKWNSRRVGERIDQPAYAGRVKFGHEGTHEALVDERTFRLAQERRTVTRTLHGNGRGRQPSIHLLSHGLLKCACGESMAPRRDSGSGRLTYRCVTRLQRAAKSAMPCLIPALPQKAVDAAVLRYLAHDVISPGLTEREMEAEQEAALTEARKARSEANRAAKQASDRLESAQMKFLDDTLTGDEYKVLAAKLEGQRQQAQQESAQASATIDALRDPDPGAMAAVQRLREDTGAVATDSASLAPYRALLVKLFESFEVVQAPADAPATVPEFPSTPTFVYRQPSPRQGREAEHRYFLIPGLQPHLAAIYDSDPVTAAPTTAIGRMGLPCR